LGAFAFAATLAPVPTLTAVTIVSAEAAAEAESEAKLPTSIPASTAAAAPAIPPYLRTISATAGWSAPANISHGPGKLASSNYGAGVSLLASPSGAARENVFYLDAEYSRTDYRFTGTEAWFADAERAGLSLYYEHKLNPSWSLLALANGTGAVERGADWADGLTGRAGAGFRFSLPGKSRFADDFSVSAGVLLGSRLSDDAQWLPYAQLHWTITDPWSRRTAAGATLAYDVFADGTLRVEFTGAWRGATFRLRKADGRTRALQGRGGVFAVGVTKEFFKRAGYVSANVGGMFWSKYKVRSYGQNIGEFECDPSLVVGLEAGVRF
jgi:outer membrane scaffolding protein for murein synthesis (MipA/OmpV family)